MEVVKRRINPTQHPAPTVLNTEAKHGQTKKTKKRNPAIIVDTKLDDFPALTKSLSKDIDQQVIGNRVAVMR